VRVRLVPGLSSLGVFEFWFAVVSFGFTGLGAIRVVMMLRRVSRFVSAPSHGCNKLRCSGRLGRHGYGTNVPSLVLEVCSSTLRLHSFGLWGDPSPQRFQLGDLSLVARPKDRSIADPRTGLVLRFDGYAFLVVVDALQAGGWLEQDQV
jgi:hypothetical protein